MKIVSLVAENFKRLVAVEITPTGDVVQITGKNAHGKSSCLDAIAAAVEGLGSCPGEPIRQGEDCAMVRVQLSGERELIVTREFERKEGGGFTSKLYVESPDGARFSKGQTLLNELLGELAFDPLGFTRMKDDEQYDAMRSFVPGVDFVRIEGLNKADYDRRTEANRAAKTARAAADMIAVPQGTPEEPIDEAALTTELEVAGTLNTDVERRTLLRAQAVKDVENYRDQARRTLDKIAPELERINERLDLALSAIDEQIATLTRQREALLNQSDPDFQAAEKKLRDEAAGFTKQADDLQARLDQAEKLPEIIDTKAIKERIEKARVTNASVAKLNLKALHLATAKRYEAEAKELTESIEARERAKETAIAAAKMPVPGLGFGNGVVLLNGVPFAQASSAEQLRASCAIAMAKNPKLRVCFIRDGSLLDEDGLRLIAEMAAANNFQVFVERVDSTGRIGFVIENGYARDAAVNQAERSAA